MPRIGMGTWPLLGSACADMVQGAVDRGYRLFDTAYKYGNEEAVGTGLRASGVPRGEVFITSKFNKEDHSIDGAQRAYDASLAALGVDYLDLFLIHWPVPARDRYVDAWRGLVKLLDQGRVKAIGVSNFDGPQIAALQALNLAPVSTNQFNWNPWAHGLHAETAEYCFKNNVIVTAHTPVGDGLRVRGPSGTTHSGWPALEQLAAKYKRSQTQIILRWELQRGVSIVPGSGNPKHIKENLDIYSFQLTDEEMDVITAFKDDERAKSMIFQPIGAQTE